MIGGVAVVGVQAGAWGARWFVVADNHEAAAPAGDPTGQLWVVTTLGHLAGQGLLERPAESMDPVALAGQRLLIAAGWLDAEPFGPSERLRSWLPAGAPLVAISGFVRELLAMLRRHRGGVRGCLPVPVSADNRPSAVWECQPLSVPVGSQDGLPGWQASKPGRGPCQTTPLTLTPGGCLRVDLSDNRPLTCSGADRPPPPRPTHGCAARHVGGSQMNTEGGRGTASRRVPGQQLRRARGGPGMVCGCTLRPARCPAREALEGLR
jgi:hypothetical protein